VIIYIYTPTVLEYIIV